jgi:diaminopimelate epimerase
MKTFPFYKMHGAGNDFILVDDREGSFPIDARAWLAAVSARRTGVGCEGIILIQRSRHADFRMRFLNPDGGEAEMCGNGARCVARLAHELGAAPKRMTIETMAGDVHAEVSGESVTLWMTEPRDWDLDGRLTVSGRAIRFGFVNSGVPHAVIETDALAEEPVFELGRAIRHHPHFAPRGTNVNFAQVEHPRLVRVRTYERGVEDETLACGTGMVATALVLARRGRVQLPVEILPASGDHIRVDARIEGESVTGVTLTGPAVHVFQGALNYPG